MCIAIIIHESDADRLLAHFNVIIPRTTVSQQKASIGRLFATGERMSKTYKQAKLAFILRAVKIVSATVKFDYMLQVYKIISSF